jgi:alanyl-tRNA synthetase
MSFGEYYVEQCAITFLFLTIKSQWFTLLIPLLADRFKEVFPELEAQKDFVQKVVLEEERSFLRTLAGGLKRIEGLEVSNHTLDGQTAFELYDTYGFPFDLTRLVSEEKGWKVDEAGFNAALQEQKERGRKDAKRETGDWTQVRPSNEVTFIGYDKLRSTDSKIIKYRTVKQKDKPVYQIVLDKTPFYAEGGGQVGDKGQLIVGDQLIKVFDTKKENNLFIHFVDQLPDDVHANVIAEVNAEKRALTENNHTATHLLHAALREILGSHVQQKGSLVKEDYLRFDFSHFQKMTDEEIAKVEARVNEKIRENIQLEKNRSIPIKEAQEAGAMMLFGEKYGERVRMITFDPEYSRELCGGCHVDATGEIGFFKLVSESAIAAGVRRVEAITASKAEAYVSKELEILKEIRTSLKNPADLIKSVHDLNDENKHLKKELEELKMKQAGSLQTDLIKEATPFNSSQLIVKKLSGMDSKTAKTLSFNIMNEVEDAVVLLGLENDGKPTLMLSISKDLVEAKGWHAGNIVRALAADIKGGGGGQPFFASAGGKDVGGLDAALAKIKEHLS